MPLQNALRGADGAGGGPGRSSGRDQTTKFCSEEKLFSQVLILTIILLAFAGATGAERRYSLISRRPYNNRYSDATGARDDRY